MDKIILKRRVNAEKPGSVILVAAPSARYLGAALTPVLVSENDLPKKLVPESKFSFMMEDLEKKRNLE